MSTLTPNCLFHFTSSADNLISIFRDEFQPKYSFEVCQVGPIPVEAAFPMVCFCDIPLSQIKEHIATYGQYGLGMSKEWAERNGLNPVFYVQRDSYLSACVAAVAQMFANAGPPSSGSMLQGGQAMLDVLRFFKPYSGEFIRDGRSLGTVRFYNEREWRFVVRADQAKIPFALTKDQFDNPVTRAAANQNVRSATLHFEPKDIKYVIIKDEREILPMTATLRTIKSHHYPSDVIDILVSRIITCEQIMNDF